MTLDLICRVIDNYGDIAVVWRLAQALVQDGGAGLRVRVLLDDWDALRALNPALEAGRDRQELRCAGGTVTVLRAPADAAGFDAADVVVEAFGAPTPDAWMRAFLAAAALDPGHPRILVHLEYLTAEAWSEAYHLLPSPLGHPGVQRHFFVPGFRPHTGGLVFTDPPAPLAHRGPEDWLMTLFSYEHDFTRFWDGLCDFLDERGESARVVVFAGRSRAGALASWAKVQASRPKPPVITVVDQNFVDQDTYTALLAAADFNVVRGEESWVQAVLAGRPFLWQAYLQEGGHQLVKVEAFLEVWGGRFEAEGEAGREVFSRVAKEFRAFNRRNADSVAETPTEGYRVFWENRSLLERVGRAWAVELRKNAKLSRKLLEFLEKVRV
jgi:uncharacterized repeat protein (TIGR03837 family)